jgi:hypothetical protein
MDYRRSSIRVLHRFVQPVNLVQWMINQVAAGDPDAHVALPDAQCIGKEKQRPDNSLCQLVEAYL